MAGAVGNRSAEAADKALPKRSGPRASAATTERATGAAGGRRGAPRHRGQTFGPQAAWDWHPDAHGRTGAAVGIDATGVPHQAPGGGAAAGGRPSGAAVSNAVPDVPRGNPHRPAPQVGGHAPGEDGPDARWHLRALVKSERGQWGALWGRQTTAPKAN